jgi:hypothetical protein
VRPKAIVYFEWIIFATAIARSASALPACTGLWGFRPKKKQFFAEGSARGERADGQDQSGDFSKRPRRAGHGLRRLRLRHRARLRKTSFRAQLFFWPAARAPPTRRPQKGPAQGGPKFAYCREPYSSGFPQTLKLTCPMCRM